jgi:DNA end-binding protein Ku
MRAIWKGTITFGLVNIPVAVFPATGDGEKIRFRQLRASDLSPIRYRKVAEADEKEVPSEQIIKGYEIEKGKYVTLTDEDFEKVQIESTHAIEISDFVQQEDINPKYFYKPYFLEPQKGGEKSYSLLHRALSETGKLGIAKVAIRSREYLAAVKPDGLFLMLELMHFAEEVLDPDTLKGATRTDVSAKELEMAKALIESMASDWEPTKYHDQYEAAVMKMIEDKAAKRPASAKAPTPRTAGDVVDLVKILQESIAKSGRGSTRTNAAAEKAEEKPTSSRTPRTKSTATLVKQRRRKGAL